MTTPVRNVSIALSSAQALVLFDWLTRCDDEGSFTYVHDAEERVVWELQAQLEKLLVEPFDPGYAYLLEKARADVVDD